MKTISFMSHSMRKSLLTVGMALVLSGTSVFAAPPQPYGSTLAAVNCGNPNGTWSLFVLDDTSPDAGVVSNGWFITLTTGNPVGFAADNALSMTPSAANVLTNANFSYIVALTNYGPSVSSNAVVSDILPSGITLVSSNFSMGSVSNNGTVVSWNVGTLATNAGAQLTLTMRSGVVGTPVNSASVQAATPDPNSNNNSASVAVNVVGSLSAPQLSGISVGASGAFNLTVLSPTTSTVIIQATTNLVTGPWMNIYTSTPPFIFTDPNATNYHSRFYRALLGP